MWRPSLLRFSTVSKKMKKMKEILWQFLRAVEEVNPKIVLFENVSASKSSIKVLHIIRSSELKNKGYEVKSEIMDAQILVLHNTEKELLLLVTKNLKFEFPKVTMQKKKHTY